jgi:hypothetical protein
MRVKYLSGIGAVGICGVFVGVASVYRLIQAWKMEWPNFSPVMVMALACGMYLRGWARWVTPVAIQLVSDWWLSVLYGFRFSLLNSWVIYGCYLFAAWVGMSLGKRNCGYFEGLAGCVGCGLFFYFATNSVAWWGEPLYVKSFEGWLQALTTGIPGYPPTWMFLRNSLASDVIFFSLLYVSVRVLAFREKKREFVLPSTS